MRKGKVKFYGSKGFGFIIDHETGEDVFLHATGLKSKGYVPRQDDEVQFETKDTKKGINAVNVERAGN